MIASERQSAERAAKLLGWSSQALALALAFFHPGATRERLRDQLLGMEGVEEIRWLDSVLSVRTRSAVLKIHPSDLEINERHGLIDRFYTHSGPAGTLLTIKRYHRDARDVTRKPGRPVYVLGVMRYGHDVSAALVRNGRLLGAIAEERLNLDKHTYTYFPKESVRYLLRAHNVAWEEIDHLAIPFDYNFLRDTPSSLQPHYYYRHRFGLPFKESYKRYDTDALQLFLDEMSLAHGSGYVPPVTFVKHHKSHAAAAYYTSGYRGRALIVSIDGQGEDESATVWVGDGATLRRISRTTPATQSLGHVYHLVAMYLGYQRNDEGKVMGFAPYGAPRNPEEERRVELLRELFRGFICFDRDLGQIRLRPEDHVVETTAGWPAINFSASFLERFKTVMGPLPSGATGRSLRPEHRIWAHLAFVVQERTEEVVADIISYYLHAHLETKGLRHVVLSGGLALNVTANGRLIERGIVEGDKFFVPAFPGDDGTPLGAALSVAAEEYGLDVHQTIENIGLGRTYSEDEIRTTLDRFGLTDGIDYRHKDSDEQLVAEVSEAIVGDKTVAWFQGGSELGPRALGNRSILNKLTDPRGNEKVNSIKGREEWRPSALSLHAHRMTEFLECIRSPSPFMTIGFPVAKEKRSVIQAGVHPSDGSTRPQTLARNANPLYWDLLDRIGQASGVPGALNSSFNRWGPIVETPEDALNTFAYAKGLDLLAMGRFIVTRNENLLPSLLNGRDEEELLEFFTSGSYRSEPLAIAWDEFWARATTLTQSRRAAHQHFLFANLVEASGPRELIRVPLMKEFFQKGTRECMVADLTARIDRAIGFEGPAMVSLDTSAEPLADIVVDCFDTFAPAEIARRWRIVRLGYGEAASGVVRSSRVPLDPQTGANVLRRMITKVKSEERARPVLLGLIDSSERTRHADLERVEAHCLVVDSRRWRVSAGATGDAADNPLLQIDLAAILGALRGLHAGHTAMLPMRQVYPGRTPERGLAPLSRNDQARYGTTLLKESSVLWVRHDGAMFEQLRPERGDVFLIRLPSTALAPAFDDLLQEQVEVRGDRDEPHWFPLAAPLPPTHIEYIAIGLTNYCPVRCSFCFMYADPKRKRRIRLARSAIDRVLAYGATRAVDHLQLGGGEPFDELGLVCKILGEAEVQSIGIFTSGYFAKDKARAEAALDRLSAALQSRRAAGRSAIACTLAVSTDEFHARVPSRSIANIIQALECHREGKYRGISLELKGIMMPTDPIPGIIRELGGSILEIPRFGNYPVKRGQLPSGYEFSIRYGEVKLMDDMLDAGLLQKDFYKGYERRLKDDELLMETRSVHLSVSYDGATSVHEYLVNDLRIANAYEETFFDDVDRRLARDPIVVALRWYGMKTIFDLAAELRPDIQRRSLAANNNFLTMSHILRDVELREHVYRRLKAKIEEQHGALALGHQCARY